jgi:glycosyltransferase involved in cell wall biosynthesis
MYRKGVDLLIGIIPKILAQFENVHFIIGGDGDGMVHL